MVSKKRRLQEKVSKLDRELTGFIAHINQSVLPRPKLRETVVVYLDQLAKFGESYGVLRQQVKETEVSKKDFFKDYMDIHFAKINTIIDSNLAEILLRDVNVTDGRKIFELHLASVGLNLSDLDGVVEAHKDAVEKFFSYEKVNVPFEFVDADDRQIYGDIAIAHKTQLDKLASSLFGRRIQTKIDVDVKEKNPHNWLGWTNIGYQHRISQLIATMAHEGPFGHQTHNNLSFGGDYIFNNPRAAATKEGLAMLGSVIALEGFYQNNPKAKSIPSFEHIFRWVSDTLSAAVEKLVYYDQASSSEMAKALATDYHSEDVLRNWLKKADDDELRHLQSPSSFAYYVGCNKIFVIHEEATKMIQDNPELKSDEKRKVAYSSLLNVMYTGMRTPEIMALEVDYFLRKHNLNNGKPISLLDLGCSRLNL